jgi:ankyrin repeat protein
MPDVHYAAYTGDLEEVTHLLQSNPDLNVFDDISYTPLHHAASKEHVEIVKVLLRAGADVNAHDEASIGNTPLSEIAGYCSFTMAKTLLEAGADPTIPGWMQLSALDRAEERKKAEGIKVYELLQEAANKKKS